MIYYIVRKNTLGEDTNALIALHDDLWLSIPSDEANTDYQTFLGWLAEGNTPEPWNPENI